MERLLNKEGQDLNLLKFKIIKGEVPEDIIPIIVEKYPSDIQQLLTNNKLDIKGFTEELKKINKYCLSATEMKELTSDSLAKTYDYELSKTNSKFTVKVVKETLIIEKFFRISQSYYNNFLGIDLPKLSNEAKNSKKRNRYYSYCTSFNNDDKTVEEKRYDKELDRYNDFCKNRLNIVLSNLKNNVFDKKIIPMYKTIKIESRRPMRIVTKIENNVGTIALHIDLDTKSEFDKNITTISKFLNQVSIGIEEQMNYNLYK